MKRPRNFRDVGQSINEIGGAPVLKPQWLFRSGAFEDQSFLLQHGIVTVISLRSTPDKLTNGVHARRVSPAGSMKNYIYADAVFHAWLTRLFRELSSASLPLLVHCTAGKDRTGVGIALLLKLLGIKDDLIVQEYLLSEGETYVGSLIEMLAMYEFSTEQYGFKTALADRFLLSDT